MLDRLFRPAPLLDNDSVAFMQSIQQWAWASFGRDHFDHQIQLVLPTNRFFPERISSVEEMAQQLLHRMQGYIGLQQWPLTVSTAAPQPLQLPAELPPPSINGAVPLPAAPAEAPAIVLHYNRLQASDPQAMIASHGQQLGACLLATAPTPPPADAEQLPLVAELLVTQMGFGIQLANSAFKFAGGCGGCGCSASGRTAYLNQDEALMALALFCHAKQIEASQVTPHLNKHLRSLFKRGLRQLQNPR
ncbi:MAG TPA: hypothetical protein VIS52_07750 [Motiliproteus sp.]